MHSLVRPCTLIAAVVVAALSTPSPLGARQLSVNTLSANLAGIALLSLSSTGLTFPDASPDAMPQVPAPPLTVTAKARTTRNAALRLTMIATDHLRSGVNTIPIDAITWTSTGAGFVGGTASRTTAQLVGQWTGSGVRIGTQQYRFRNLWTYATGTYTVTFTYTLTSP